MSRLWRTSMNPPPLASGQEHACGIYYTVLFSCKVHAKFSAPSPKVPSPVAPLVPPGRPKSPVRLRRSKNRTPKKATQNHKKSAKALVRPFWEPFWHSTSLMFHICCKRRKSWKIYKNSWCFKVFALPRPHFSHKIQIPNSPLLFFFRTSFFSLVLNCMPKLWIL